MPRPTTKKQLLAAMQSEREALETLLATLTDGQMTSISPVTQVSVKDVLAHILEWEQMCLGWYKTGLRGKTPDVPAKGFKWSQTPALNKQIYEKYHPRPLAEVMKHFRASYRQISKTIQGLSEKELFTPGRYTWTKKLTLGTYFVSATSSHYLWARKEVQKCLKGSG